MQKYCSLTDANWSSKDQFMLWSYLHLYAAQILYFIVLNGFFYHKLAY